MKKGLYFIIIAGLAAVSPALNGAATDSTSLPEIFWTLPPVTLDLDGEKDYCGHIPGLEDLDLSSTHFVPISVPISLAAAQVTVLSPRAAAAATDALQRETYAKAAKAAQAEAEKAAQWAAVWARLAAAKAPIITPSVGAVILRSGPYVAAAAGVGTLGYYGYHNRTAITQNLRIAKKRIEEGYLALFKKTPETTAETPVS